MQHPGLPPHLALQFPTMDSLSSDLTQLCQQQLGLDPNFLQQSQFKRPRTRITDDQLKILRAHFDINNSPNEEQIQEMAEKSGLPQKVIKHWFRNTLFKERQRSKDSPYNFNIPPMTTLEDIRLESQMNMLEYYRTDATTNKGHQEHVSQIINCEYSKISLILMRIPRMMKLSSSQRYSTCQHE